MSRTAVIARASIAGLLLVLVSGCSQYLDRRESVSKFGGDAQQANIATHVINPLPPASADRKVLINGQVAQRGNTSYRTGQSSALVDAKAD